MSEKLFKYRPRISIRILFKSEIEKEFMFIRFWALAALLAWATLDQRPGNRERPRRFRTKNAKNVSIIVLGIFLDRTYKERPQNFEKIMRALLTCFFSAGGFASAVCSRSPAALLSQYKKAKDDLVYVKDIAEYMCRYAAQFETSGANFSIESAKAFVLKFPPKDAKKYKKSKISKIWEKYKEAAPLIFAAYDDFLCPIFQIKSASDILSKIPDYQLNIKTVRYMLQRAAHCSQILSHVRNTRENDYRDVTLRPKQEFRAFDEQELATINAIDRNAPIL